MQNDRIAQLERQKQAIDSKLQAAKEKKKQLDDKLDNKRKFLLGAMLEKWMEEDEQIRKQAEQRIRLFLNRKSDRRVFGLDV